MIEVVLLDLDGVVRHFDEAHRAEVETRHGLRPGILWETAFQEERINPVITGRRTAAEWIQSIGEAVDNVAAANEWMSHDGVVDQDMLREVDRLRDGGITVAILTNGTDTVPRELDELGVTPRVDAIFNSAEIGYAKPDRRAFEHCCGALGVAPETVFFTDDSERKLAGAREIGMTAELYVDLPTFKRHLDGLDLAHRS